MEQQEKFQRFETAVFAEVDAQVEKIRAEAEMQKERELQRNKDAQLAKSANLVQKKTQEIRRECKRDVAKYSLECKRGILQKRTELEKKVFRRVEELLSDFAATEEYRKWLLGQVESFAKSNSLSGAAILVNTRDAALAGQIEKAYGLPCSVQTDDPAVGIGGFIVRSDRENVYFDGTLSRRLAGQKAYFIENSGLSLA